MTIVALAMLAAMLGGTTVARGDSMKQFLVEVEPPVAVDATATDFTITFTNLVGTPLGALELTAPTGFVINSVSGVQAPTGKTWVSQWPVAGNSKVRLLAVTQTDRLGLGESVSIVVNATTPDINTGTNDVDIIAAWLAEGRQANNFNSGGNDSFQDFQEREDIFVYRDGDGLSSSALLTNEVLVVSGTANDCTGNCTGNDSQANVSVRITIEGCDAGTLVVDATDLFPNDDPISIAGFYHYLEDENTCVPEDPSQTVPVVIDFLYDKSLNVKPGELEFAAFYGVPILDYDPAYVGDGNPLPSCKGRVTVNCVEYVTGGNLGVEAQIVLVLVPTDPGGVAFR